MGQCLPNRPEVKIVCGVKIFLDPGGVSNSHERTKAVVRKVFENPEPLCDYFNVEDDVTYLTATHEMGHAVYNLLRTNNTELSTVLEEPRAELCTIFMLKVLCEKSN
eukprot:UN04444